MASTYTVRATAYYDPSTLSARKVASLEIVNSDVAELSTDVTAALVDGYLSVSYRRPLAEDGIPGDGHFIQMSQAHANFGRHTVVLAAA